MSNEAPRMSKNEKQHALVPRLRFPEFRDSQGWPLVPLQQLAERITTRNSDESTTRVLTNSAEHGVVDQRDYFDKDIATNGNLGSYYVVEHGDYVYNPRVSAAAPVGPISRNNIDQGVMSPLYTVFRFNRSDTDFYAHYFKSTSWHSYLRSVSSTGARHDRMSITNGDFMRMPVPDPQPAEQHKIAAFLNSLDDLIAAEGRKLAALRDHKKGLMQQLFPRGGETRPRLRFPEFQNAPEWDVLPLEKLAKRITTRNTNIRHSRVLTNSAELGVVDQGSYFDREIVTKSNLDTYYVIEKGDFVYNPRISNVAPVGPVSRNNLGIGVVSPLYTVFRFANPSTDYFTQLFKTSVWHPYLKEASNSGARHDRMNISTADFMNLPLPVPSPAEQQRIADCLSALDALISVQTEKLEALRTQKRGLMQQLFPSPEDAEA